MIIRKGEKQNDAKQTDVLRTSGNAASSHLQSNSPAYQFRRMPAVPRKISEINAEKDIRIRILGRVIDKYDGTIVVDDGTGKAEIVVEDTNIPFNGINSGDFVRVFTRVLPLETSYELRAEIVQKVGTAFADLNKKVNG